MLNVQNLNWVMPEYTAILPSNYGVENEKVRALYFKGEAGQWKTSDLDWTSSFDFANPLGIPPQALPLHGSDLWNRMSSSAKTEYLVHHQSITLSNLLHGEAGGAMIIGKLLTNMPTNDDRFFMSTQLSDEYRHAVIIDRLITERLKIFYPIKDSAYSIVNRSIINSNWDINYLIGSVLEYCGALNLQSLSAISTDPLIKVAFEKMYTDEARHVAYSKISLKDYYTNVSYTELKEREQLMIETIHNLESLINYDDLRKNLNLPKEEFDSWCDPILNKRRIAVLNFMKPWLIGIGLFTDNIKKEYARFGIL